MFKYLVLILLPLLVTSKVIKNDEKVKVDLPLTCYQCDSEESCKQAPGNPAVCETDSEQCVTKFMDGKLTNRGCEKKVDCATGDCKKCKSSNCNVATSIEEYKNCYDCFTFDNKDCLKVNEKTPKRSCYKTCLTQLIPTSEGEKTFEIIRGCLDDLEEIERDKCTNNPNDMCQKCNDKECNKEIIPANRLKCFKCEGPDCLKQPKSDVCDLYQKDDKCMVEFDNKNVKLRFGCASSISDDKIFQMQLENKIFLCEDDECNAQENLPKENTCSKCSSFGNDDCIINLKSDKVKTEKCEASANTKCYSSFDEKSGLVSRGCWSEMTANDEKAKCLKGENCNLCDTEYCNEEAIPKDRIECNVCNSDVDPNCHDNPTKKQLSLRYIKNDTCVTKFIHGNTLRGSSADIGACNGLDRFSCRQCNKGNCNTVNLKDLVNDENNRGMWQDLPLKCKSCKGETECADPSKVKTKLCKANSDECITVFKDENTVQSRGCSSEVLNDPDVNHKCDTTPGLCPHCKSNECNIAKSKSEYKKCYYCGWPNSKSCNFGVKVDETHTRECYKSCMTVAYPVKKEENKEDEVYDIVRTCLDDLEAKDQQKCNRGDCKSCTDELCNKEQLFDNWSKCYTCANKDECKKPVLKECPSYNAKEGCYYVYDRDVPIQGGCLSKLDKALKLKYLIENKIHFCDGTDCNKEMPVKQKCVACKSSEKDQEECATEPGKNENLMKVCSVPNSRCYTILTKDGANERGCLSDLKENILDCLKDGNNTCTACYGADCNNKIYPEKRLKCYVCDSDSDGDCEKDPTNMKVCPIYDENQECVSKYTDGKTERHCSKHLECDRSDTDKCQYCKDATCNNENLKSKNGSGSVIASVLLISFTILLKSILN